MVNFHYDNSPPSVYAAQWSSSVSPQQFQPRRQRGEVAVFLETSEKTRRWYPMTGIPQDDMNHERLEHCSYLSSNEINTFSWFLPEAVSMKLKAFAFVESL